jgi:hypothetical protein
VRPADTRGLWQVELRITVRGGGRQGSVTALLPGPAEGQVVLDERSTSDRLQFSIRARDDLRVGVWQGRLEGVHEIFYQFRVQSRGVPCRCRTAVPAPAELVKATGAPAEFRPPPSARHLDRLSLPPPRTPWTA